MTQAEIEALGWTDRALVAAYRETFPDRPLDRVDLAGDSPAQRGNREFLFDELSAEWMLRDPGVPRS